MKIFEDLSVGTTFYLYIDGIGIAYKGFKYNNEQMVVTINFLNPNQYIDTAIKVSPNTKVLLKKE